ncbi:MAG: hypothetical protein FJ290_26795 [Planctomycetes bacterium]|nr:hypothetical protein [Planctomycetota bacterium]
MSDLFRLIDQGYPQAHVPAYNGGLFSPEKHPHIAHTPQPGATRWEIADDRLAHVIDMLAYQRERWDQPGANDVDYATLDVQHLGSIYEGLLELQPRCADGPMVETTQDGKPIFRPASEVPNPRPIRGAPPRSVRAGEIYLVTNRGERKATGSYYTPKYIVDYIVENTVGPLADEAAGKAKELRPQVDSELRKLARLRKERENGVATRGSPVATRGPRVGVATNGSPVATRGSRVEQDLRQAGRLSPRNGAVAQVDRAIEAEKWKLLAPYLDLKILDPAMGSGHFLVGAADFLSLAMATDPNLLPLSLMAEEDPQVFYKRLVVERCLYGVDLNPLAVELAKLSLWLHTVSRDKALSFLDHHLRCGNSLIGGRIEQDLMTPPPEADRRGRPQRDTTGQRVLGFAEALTTRHLSGFLDTFRQIVERPSATAEDAHLKDRLYREMDAARDRYRAVANLWLAPYFGCPIHIAEYSQAVASLSGTPAAWGALICEPWFKQAQSIAKAKRFFHWELEFPEVFFDPRALKPEESRGFHCVTGNPPYVRQEAIRDLKPFLASLYDQYHPAADLYLYFVEKGHSLASRSRGLFGMILSNKWLRAAYGQEMRRYLGQRTTVLSIIDLAGLPVFGATVRPLVLVTAARPSSSAVFRYLPPLGPDAFAALCAGGSLSRAQAETGHDLPTSCLAADAWAFVSTQVQQLSERIRASSVPLQQYVGSRPLRGVITGFNEAFVIDGECRSRLLAENPEAEAIIKPLLAGEDIRRFAIEFSDRYLIWTYIGVPIDRFPAVMSHLAASQAQLEVRCDKGDEWWELRACDYYDKFTKPKIIYPDISTHCRFTMDRQGFFGTNTTYIIPADDAYVLALLNSRVACFYLSQVCAGLEGKKDNYLRFFAQYMEGFPIRRIGFTTPSAERGRLVAEGKRLYNEAVGRLTS